jgi:uncharacterized protein
MMKKTPKKNDRPGVDRMGRTALHYAALEQNSPEVRKLLAAGLDPNARDDNGFTPLHFATQSNSLSASEALLSAGAEVDATDCNGNTPLSNAVFNSGGEGSLITLLLEAGANPDMRNNHGVSPLQLAGSIANFDLVRFFKARSAGAA